jgi:hypothetical protein
MNMVDEQIEITKVIEIIEGSGGEQLTIPLQEIQW